MRSNEGFTWFLLFDNRCCSMKGCNSRTFRTLAGIRYHVNHFHTREAEPTEDSLITHHKGENSLIEMKEKEESEEAMEQGRRDHSVGEEDKSVEGRMEEHERGKANDGDEVLASLRAELRHTRQAICPNKVRW